MKKSRRVKVKESYFVLSTVGNKLWEPTNEDLDNLAKSTIYAMKDLFPPNSGVGISTIATNQNVDFAIFKNGRKVRKLAGKDLVTSVIARMKKGENADEVMTMLKNGKIAGYKVL